MSDRETHNLDLNAQATVTQNITISVEQVWFNSVLTAFHFFGTPEQSIDFADDVVKAFKYRFIK